MVHYGISSRMRRPPIPPHSKETASGSAASASASTSRHNSSASGRRPNVKGIISAPLGPPNVRSPLSDDRRLPNDVTGGENTIESSDESMQWDEFFGQSVDIASALLDMYDSLIAQNKDDEETNGNDSPEASSSYAFRSGPGNLSPVQESCHPDSTTSSASPNDSPCRFVPCVTITSVSSSSSSVSSSTAGAAGRLHYSDSGVGGKNRRPLSASSLSSSSSSSSSSLPRNGMDVKKSYLASIESLDDDASEDEVKGSKVSGAGASQTTSGSMTLDTTPPYTRGLVTPSPSSTLASIASSNASCLPGSSGGVISSAVVSSSGLTHIDRVLLEIVETERTYVSDLRQIIQGYLKRIPTTGREAKISESDFAELFGNIEDIYRFNSMFLSELEQCGFDPVGVARAFVQHSNGFAIYTQYCTNYPRTVEVLTELMGKPKTAEVFKERQTALHHNLPLGSYLLKPVQRILKYHLLLQNIVKHSDKESGDYPDIKNALSVMTGIAYHINDMKRKHEHAVRVQEIQSLLYGWQGHDLTTYGELVAEGSFRMLGAKALRHIFLFDKMLVIAKKKEEAILSYKTHIMCSNLMLIESIQGEPLCFHVIPFDYPKLQYTFQARNLEQKREWCLQLKRVILENYNAVIPSHARQLVMELGQNKPGEMLSMEKTNNSSSRSRLLSAPEYLERRKHDRDRRKSEISLNRAFKLRKSSKKMSRRTRSCSTQEQAPLDNEDSNLSCEESRHADTTTNSSPSKRLTSPVENNHGVSVKTYSPTSSSRTNETEANKDTKPKKAMHPAFRAWKSLPEETTDTENEDGNDQANVRRLLQYRPPTSRSGIPGLHHSASVEDEYVTLFFAQAHAYREAAANNSYLAACAAGDRSSIAFADQGDDDDEIFRRDIKPEKAPLPRKKTSKKSDNYDNLTALWAELGTVNLKNLETDEEEKSDCDDNIPPSILPPPVLLESASFSTDLEQITIRNPKTNFSWRRNPAVRRVQSFTGLARAKVASLQHSFSFKQSPSRSGQLSDPEGSSGRFLPADSFDEVLSPTAPAIWLKRQEGHLSDGKNKCGSLPRSFQLGFTDEFLANSIASNSSSTIASVSDETAIEKETSCRPRMRSEGSIIRPNPMNHQMEQRPITIASDKPMQVDFMDDIEGYMDNASRKRRSYRFPVQQDEFESGIEKNLPKINSPSISLENVNHTIHPEHKIYHHSASKYAAFKNVLSNVGSKFAILKASVSPNTSGGGDLTAAESCSTVSGDSEVPSFFNSKRNLYVDHSPSRCSSQFDRELSPSTLTNKVMNSIAKAYSAMIKQRLRKENYPIKLPESGSNTPASIRKGMPPYRPSPNSSVIGARMARPLESEYCVPKTLMHLPSPSTSRKKEDLRPDSVLSESSNTTSSSDGDKKKDSTYVSRNSIVPEVLAAVNPLFNVDLDQDDSPSDTSVASGDSYYERTFEAIENALVDEMFRDSAIYSDPEEADLSSTELNNQVYHQYHRHSRDFTLKNHLIENKGKANVSQLTNNYKTDEEHFSIDNVQNMNCEISLTTNEKTTESIIMERLKILEENSKFRKGDPNNGRSTLEGIKSIRQRRQELEKSCLAQGKTEETAINNDENDFANSVLSKWKETAATTTTLAENPEIGAPKMKGWVKHVVHKLQSEHL